MQLSLIPKLKLQFWNLSSAHSTGTHNYTCSVSRTHQAALVLAIKRSTTDALTIISDVIKVKAIQCASIPIGDFSTHISKASGYEQEEYVLEDANEPQR